MPVYDGVDGVVRKRKEWPVGIGGVVRQQNEHWAGIDGVQRKIFSAAPKEVLITIVGVGAPVGYAWVVIDGAEYTEATQLQISTGSVIAANAWQRPDQGSGICGVYVNGSLVTSPSQSSAYGSLVTYNFTANTDTTIYLKYVSGSPSTRLGLVSIASNVYEHQFTVNGRPYQFDPGMTWNTFVSSAYNVDHFQCTSFVLNPITNSIIRTSDGNVQVPNMEILENGTYISL